MKLNRLVVWIFSGVLAALFLFSGATKLAGMQMHVEHFAQWGYPAWFMYVVGGWEVIGAITLLIPSLAYYAAIFLGIDMIGAILTHLKTPGQTMNALFPLVLLILLALVAYTRRGAKAVSA